MGAMDYCIYLAIGGIRVIHQEGTLKRHGYYQHQSGPDQLQWWDRLIGCYGLAVEVKRQETLSLNTWWKQCELSANRDNSVPVLIYRQNKQKWRVRTYLWIPLPGGTRWKPLQGQVGSLSAYWFHRIGSKATLQK